MHKALQLCTDDYQLNFSLWSPLAFAAARTLLSLLTFLRPDTAFSSLNARVLKVKVF